MQKKMVKVFHCVRWNFETWKKKVLIFWWDFVKFCKEIFNQKQTWKGDCTWEDFLLSCCYFLPHCVGQKVSFSLMKLMFEVINIKRPTILRLIDATYSRRTRNLNILLPLFNILLPPSFLRHFINLVPNVYTS